MNGCMETANNREDCVVSVIIPVYNVQEYLGRCMDSVLKQTYSALEILLIDDGSTDKSGELCDAYGRAENRVRVVHQKNQGLASARNVGIELASGTWITFVDSDDWVAPDYVEQLLSLIHMGADMAVCGAQKMWTEDRLPDNKSPKIWICDRDTALQKMFYQKIMDNNAWGKLYSLQLAKQVRYPDGFWYEDFATTYRLICNCERVIISSCKLYAYVQRPSSIMNRGFSEKRFELLDFADRLYEEICERAPRVTPAARARCISAYFQVLLSLPTGTNQYDAQRERIWRFIQQHRGAAILDWHIRHKNRVALLLSYAGERNLRRVWDYWTRRKTTEGRP